MTTEALPDWIGTPLAAVLRDVLPEDLRAPDMTWEAQGDDTGLLSIAGTDVSRTFEKNELAPATLAVEVATWVQDAVLPHLAPDLDVQPPCPGHHHPQRPKMLYAVAWWSCPESGTPIDVIGG